MLLNFIGNGSSFNIVNGNNCAYYKEGNKILFLDFGESIFEKVRKLNLMEDINEVYVANTHLHSDHVGSLPNIIFYDYYIKNIKTNIIKGYPLKDKNLHKFFELGGVKDFFYNWCDDKLNNAFKTIESLKFIPVSHTTALQDSSAILISLKDGRKIHFSGDANDKQYVLKVVESLKDGDEFYCDTCLADYEGNVHMNVDLLASLVPIEKRKQVYCMHFDNEKLLAKIQEYGFNTSKVTTNELQSSLD